MKSMSYSLKMKFVRIINIALITALFTGCWYLYYRQGAATLFYRKGDWLLIAFYAVLYYYFSNLYEGFNFTYSRVSELIYSQSLGFLVSDGMIYVVISLLSKRLVNIVPGLICFVCQIIVAALWSVISHRWYFSAYSPRKSAVVCETRQGIENLIDEYGLKKKFDVQRTYSVSECIENLDSLSEFQTVFLSDVHTHERNIILKYCVANKIGTFIIPRVGDTIMSSAKRMHMFHLPVLSVGRYNPDLVFIAVKRLFDIIISAIGLIVLSPIILVTSLAIKKYDNGPVFYKQCRLTKDGKEFYVVKFRSMKVDAEKNGAQLSSGEKDDRITPVGRIIRKLRIDEIPQLWNILNGDMSIVGPRPERPEIAAVYEEELPEFALRLQAKAGLTGYAQVYGKYNTTPYDKLLMDLMYISNPSIVEDLKIMFATIKIIFMPESTEGVAEGQTTAMGSEKNKSNLR